MRYLFEAQEMNEGGSLTETHRHKMTLGKWMSHPDLQQGIGNHQWATAKNYGIENAGPKGGMLG